MPLNPQQTTEFCRILGNAFTHASLDRMLSLRLGRRLELYAIGDDLRDIIAKLVRTASDENWIEQLITAATDDNPGNADLKTFAYVTLAVLNPPIWYQARNHFDTCFLQGKRAFIGRRELRRLLSDLDSHQHAVLIVEGPPVSGKTYSLQLIAYLANELKNYKVARVDLKRDALVQYNPDTLVKSIALQMGLPTAGIPPRNPDAAEANWVLELRDWLVGEVNKMQDTWWVIIDGFQSAVLPTATTDLIRHLVDWADSMMPPPLRIVLLDYPEVIPGETASNIKREKITRVSDVDLRDFFKQLLLDKNIVPDAAVIDLAVGKVNEMVVLTPESPERLPQLAAAVKQVSEQLFS